MFRGRSRLLRRWALLTLLALATVATISSLSWRAVDSVDGAHTYNPLSWRPGRTAPSSPLLPPSRGKNKNNNAPPDQNDAQKPTSPRAKPPPPENLQPYIFPEDAAEMPASGPRRCPPDLRHLQSPKLGLSNDFIYHRRCVRTVYSATVDRDHIPTLKESLLLDTPQQLQLSECAAAAPPTECTPLELTVPEPYPPEPADHMVFGVASTAARLFDSMLPFAHWLAGTNAKLVGIVADPDTAPDGADVTGWLTAYYASHGINAAFSPVVDRSHTVSQTHFTMLREMLDASTAATRWFGVLDDDTFAPSLHALSAALDALDDSKPLYVGALSEDFNSNKRYGHMAFGGAGAFLSRPLVEQLVPHLDACLAAATTDTGDGLLRECIERRTRSRLTILPGLWQQDIAEDASGFFEGDPRPLLTVHHWKSWYHDPIEQMAAVTRWCGACFLQRWRFGRDTVLTNGYSIAVYARGHKRLKLGRTEATWRFADSGYFDFAMGPLRPRVAPAEKRQFKVVRAGAVPGGRFVQTYVHRAEEGGMDEVVDLVWE